MAILINAKTRALVQGITGKEGLKAAISMRDYGTTVLAGVTPSKGGSMAEGFPVYNTVSEALAHHPEITTSVLYVPAPAVFDATVEAIESSIPLITIVTEHVPMQDAARLCAIARCRQARIVGPSSIGIIAPGIGKIGSIGGFTPSRSYTRGQVGVISKSGGMCSEISHMLTNVGFGQSTVIGVGGDRIIGTTFADLLEMFEKDADTKLVVLYGEIGGTYEEQAAQVLVDGRFTKPLVACVSGIFAETLPSGLTLGHAGAIIDRGVGTRRSKITALQRAGAHLAETSDEIPDICKNLLST